MGYLLPSGLKRYGYVRCHRMGSLSIGQGRLPICYMSKGDYFYILDSIFHRQNQGCYYRALVYFVNCVVIILFSLDFQILKICSPRINTLSHSSFLCPLSFYQILLSSGCILPRCLFVCGMGHSVRLGGILG